MTDIEDRPDIEERYNVASVTANLRVESHRTGAADILIAAGWTKSRLGHALLRLHTEYDRAEKPRKPSLEAIAHIAVANPMTVKDSAGKDRQVPNGNWAAAEAGRWYMAETNKLIGAMTTLNEVREGLIGRCENWGMTNARDKVGETIRFWLDQTCQVCHGLKFQIVPGAPALSTKMCKSCQAAGTAQIPYGKDGRRIAAYMDECLDVARARISKRLHGLRNQA